MCSWLYGSSWYSCYLICCFSPPIVYSSALQSLEKNPQNVYVCWVQLSNSLRPILYTEYKMKYRNIPEFMTTLQGQYIFQMVKERNYAIWWHNIFRGWVPKSMDRKRKVTTLFAEGTKQASYVPFCYQIYSTILYQPQGLLKEGKEYDITTHYQGQVDKSWAVRLRCFMLHRLGNYGEVTRSLFDNGRIYL